MRWNHWIAVSLAGGLAAAAIAQPPAAPSAAPTATRPARMSGSKMPSGGDPGERSFDSVLMGALAGNSNVAQRLGLSDEQVSAIRSALEEEKALREALHSRLEEAAMEQARLLSEPQVDEAAVMAAVDRTFELRKQIAKQRVKHLILLKNTLTPEQRDQAQKLFRDHLQQRQRMRGDRSPGDRGAAADGGATPSWRDHLRDRMRKGGGQAPPTPPPPATSGSDPGP
jgi:Spy/CpxP family protein refolding chaperone